MQGAVALAEFDETPRPPERRRRLSPGGWVLGVYSVLVLVFLLIADRLHDRLLVQRLADARTSSGAGSRFDNWLNVCDDPRVCESFGNSIIVGVIGDPRRRPRSARAIAIALVRYTFRFRTVVTLLLFLPMATPEVVLGAGLGSQFLTAGHRARAVDRSSSRTSCSASASSS